MVERTTKIMEIWYPIICLLWLNIRLLHVVWKEKKRFFLHPCRIWAQFVLEKKKTNEIKIAISLNYLIQHSTVKFISSFFYRHHKCFNLCQSSREIITININLTGNNKNLLAIEEKKEDKNRDYTKLCCYTLFICDGPTDANHSVLLLSCVDSTRQR